VPAAVVEHRARTGHEIDDRSGHQDLAGLCGFADATCAVDGDAGEVPAASFDFTGVDPDPNVEADLAGGVADRGPTTRNDVLEIAPGSVQPQGLSRPAIQVTCRARARLLGLSDQWRRCEVR
jgi:hypothetical protein